MSKSTSIMLHVSFHFFLFRQNIKHIHLNKKHYKTITLNKIIRLKNSAWLHWITHEAQRLLLKLHLTLKTFIYSILSCCVFWPWTHLFTQSFHVVCFDLEHNYLFNPFMLCVLTLNTIIYSILSCCVFVSRRKKSVLYVHVF